MNTLENIQKKENDLKYLVEKGSKNKIVCFGASKALVNVLKILSEIHVVPHYVCDNDIKKQDSIVEGYRVYSPNELFIKKHKFIVIISSMFAPEIKKQLLAFKNIILAEYYLSIVSSEMQMSTVKCLKESVLGENIKYLNYSSYCNHVIANIESETNIPLINCKYNFNKLYFRRVVEYFLLNKKLDEKSISNLDDTLVNTDLSSIISTVSKNLSMEKISLIQSTQNFVKKSDHALIIHLYYLDMFDEMCKEIECSSEIFDIYISINLNVTIEEINNIISVYPNVNIFLFENRGRDVLPFLKIFKYIYKLGYLSVCKVHSKKSLHNDSGKEWGIHLRKRLFDSADKIISTLNNSLEMGGYVAKNNLVHSSIGIGVNESNILKVVRLLNIDFSNDFYFPYGTMFWCKVESIRQLALNSLDSKYFPIEEGLTDGNIEHGIERVIGLLVQENGFRLEEI